MVKSILSIALFGLSAGVVRAQDTLQVQGTAPGLYITHTVKKGENFYSLSRAYGLPPKEIAAANKITMEQGLQLGRSIHIPLTAANFSQKADAAGKPVYHKVTDKETLYRVSVNFNKVPLDNIRQWNSFSGDGLKKDSYLIIGFVKGSGGATTPAEVPARPAPVEKEKPAVAVTEPVAPAPKKEVPKKEPEARPVTDTPETTTTPAVPAPKPVVATSNDFEQLYDQQTSGGKKAATEKGPGTWFKSNAVGKYYALHNTAPRGTIIKVTNPLNGKAVYAKVLDVIPQMKSNAGLIIKLSDSAMQALGSNETRFYCELNYDDK
ncbi:LysM peptidoglycan-binding domain-containing protein [Chitinophaga nivalis]|uniref:LysM peptidoglycan-binding domain-containing protein n=1 Tax=Chitinophaga nivalis TaxID=2991709 RepID=A0ABT3IG73_9BACT|nr:LysM peptidoglycan-binding domain-containing protein [Chitinophaga nivalis]MCW3467392.1 LysM peptidoglycan-binding domain-containing protein [Chitinophaga nivalis]MCW3482916.1 LysM peptidoglycan-binding domain-containing protein [Chitinophaga nivalis]